MQKVRGVASAEAGSRRSRPRTQNAAAEPSGRFRGRGPQGELGELVEGAGQAAATAASARTLRRAPAQLVTWSSSTFRSAS